MSKQISRGAILALALAASSACYAATITIQLQAYPNEAVADGRSSIAITLFVRNSDGSNVPDGTQIVLNSTLGNFRETIVRTTSGVARSILVSGNITGTARITAATLQNQSNPSILEVEFVSDRSKLSSSNDFLELSSTGSLEYTFAKKIATASATDKGVKFQIRDRLLQADDLQYLYDAQVVRARQATFKVGTKDIRFSDIYLDLRTLKGYGVTEIDNVAIDRVRYSSGLFIFEHMNPLTDQYELAKSTKRTAVVAISKTGISIPTESVRSDIFDFVPIRKGIVPTTEAEVKSEKEDDFETIRITAKRMTVVSRKEIQFQRATFYIGESKIFSQQLFRLDAQGMQGKFPTEQYLSFNNNQFGMNIPYYLSLERNQAQNLRFSTGQTFGRGYGANRGVFFDYEQSWNRSNGDGKFTYSGIGRDDFNLGLRQFTKLDDNTTASFAIDSPQAKSLISSAAISRYQPGLQTSLSGSILRSLNGTNTINRQDYFLVMEKDPIKMGKLPWNLYYGLNATYSKSATTTGSGFGARLRFISKPFITDQSGGTINAGLTFAQFAGSNVATPFASTATLNYSKPFGQKFNMMLTYDYARDGITEQAFGLHRVSGQFFFDDQKFSGSMFASQSLGQDRLSLFADSSYRIANLWRVGYQYTLNRYSGSNFVDYNVVLGYRIGTDRPEFGLLYSQQTKRVGLVLLGISR
ncbi:MAG: hypothetical protein WCI55_03720 [Armatimonadota bacterium]